MNMIGVNVTAYWDMSPEENLKMLSGIGFESFFTGFSGFEKSAEYAEYAEKYGIRYESIHAPFKHINDIWKDDDDGKAMLKELTDCTECCGRLGIPTVVVHLSSGNDAPGICDNGIRNFDALMECAEKNGVTVAYENQRKLANIAFVMERYENSKSLGFCWDMGHEAVFAHGREYMPLFGDKLVYTHIHDNLLSPEHDYHMIPFDGISDFGRKAGLLKKYGYKGTLTLEVLPASSKMYFGYTPREYYERAYRAITKFRDMVNE